MHFSAPSQTEPVHSGLFHASGEVYKPQVRSKVLVQLSVVCHNAIMFFPCSLQVSQFGSIVATLTGPTEDADRFSSDLSIAMLRRPSVQQHKDLVYITKASKLHKTDSIGKYQYLFWNGFQDTMYIFVLSCRHGQPLSAVNRCCKEWILRKKNTQNPPRHKAISLFTKSNQKQSSAMVVGPIRGTLPTDFMNRIDDLQEVLAGCGAPGAMTQPS